MCSSNVFWCVSEKGKVIKFADDIRKRCALFSPRRKVGLLSRKVERVVQFSHSITVNQRTEVFNYINSHPMKDPFVHVLCYIISHLVYLGQSFVKLLGVTCLVVKVEILSLPPALFPFPSFPPSLSLSSVTCFPFSLFRDFIRL